MVSQSRQFIEEFYREPKVKILFSKTERQKLWKTFKENKVLDSRVAKLIPSIQAEVSSALSKGGLLQAAILSECVYSFHLAEIMGLTNFQIHENNVRTFDPEISKSLQRHKISPRYSYSDKRKSKYLVQAGGPGSIDALFIDVIKGVELRIEFKEPKAKSQEPDLNYSTDGSIDLSPTFHQSFPQFESMIREAKSRQVNIFTLSEINRNFTSFSISAIESALDGNFRGEKSAAIICTEDSKGYLTAFLSEDLLKFVDPIVGVSVPGYKGEIRSAGKNSYSVWSADKLIKYIKSLGGKILDDNTVNIRIEKLSKRKPRGGVSSDYSGWNITSVFWLRKDAVRVGPDGIASFELNSVKQKKSTISAHMFFTKLKYEHVQETYVVD
jgi:hypothetical protein